MHILTGLLLSRLFASKGPKKTFRGFRGIVEIRHSIPGRVRFHVPVLKKNIEKGAMLEKELKKAAAIRQISVNPLLGSVLVVYDPEKINEVTLTAVLAKLLGLEKEMEKPPRSVIGQQMAKFIKSANSSVYEQTDGLMDLNAAITVSFLSLGVWSLLRNPRVLPAGVSMIYWAYNNVAANASAGKQIVNG